MFERIPEILGGAAKVAIFAMMFASLDAYAVPSFERQTGMHCAACHTVFPELTPLGRQFKLGGYTLSRTDKDTPFLPLAAALLPSATRTGSTGGAEPDMFPRDRELVLQQAGVYYAGKIAGKSGAFINWTYDGIRHHGNLEMTDIRLADSSAADGRTLVYGLTLHNAPTVQDVWNSTPRFGFPYVSSTVAQVPAARALVDGSLNSQVGGLGAYALWNEILYAELSLYRTANSGILEVLGTGTEITKVVQGTAPYWRLVLQKAWGSHSLSAGTYGLAADIFPDSANPGGPTDRFRDAALDGQYQYIEGDHIFSGRANWIREKQDWDASLPAGAAANPSDILKTFKLNFSYFYQRRVGGTLGYFATTGDTDAGLYKSGEPVAGSATGSPDSRGIVLELNYLPWESAKLALQYTAYRKFNGSGTNYDGFGRNASDNNTLYLLGWLLF